LFVLGTEREKEAAGRRGSIMASIDVYVGIGVAENYSLGVEDANVLREALELSAGKAGSVSVNRV